MTTTKPEPGQPIDIGKIIEYLPHRFPFLLVDRVLDWALEPVKKLTAVKCVTVNEPFFPGHFPNNPVMPGVLIVEAMAQAAGVLAHADAEFEGRKGELYYLVKVDKARFSRPVVPGDRLVMEVEMTRLIRGMGQYRCAATVDGKRAASCELLCAGKKA